MMMGARGQGKKGGGDGVDWSHDLSYQMIIRSLDMELSLLLVQVRARVQEPLQLCPLMSCSRPASCYRGDAGGSLPGDAVTGQPLGRLRPWPRDPKLPRSGLKLFELPPCKPEEPQGQVIMDSHPIPFRFLQVFSKVNENPLFCSRDRISHTYCTVVETTPLARSLQAKTDGTIRCVRHVVIY